MAISEGEKKVCQLFYIWSIFQKYPAKYKIQDIEHWSKKYLTSLYRQSEELHISNRAKKRRKFLNSNQQKLHFITYYLLISILTISVLNSLKSLVLTRFKNLFTYFKKKETSKWTYYIHTAY